MKFKLLSEVQTTVLKTVVSAGDKAISAQEVENITGVSKRTAYNSLIGMAAVGILDQVKTEKSKLGRPIMGYIATDLGIDVLETNRKVLDRAATISVQAATA